jgi:hypothetical protein
MPGVNWSIATNLRSCFIEAETSASQNRHKKDDKPSMDLLWLMLANLAYGCTLAEVFVSISNRARN